MAKKLLTFALVAMLVVAFSITASAKTLVIDGSEQFAAFADGESPWFMQSGGPDYALDSGNLWIENRNNDYDALDFVVNSGDGGDGEAARFFGEANLEDGDYVLEFSVTMAQGTTFELKTNRDGGWTTILESGVNATSFSGSVNFSVKDNETLRNAGAVANCKVIEVSSLEGDDLITTGFRFQTAEPFSDFAVTELKIYSLGGDGGGGNDGAGDGGADGTGDDNSGGDAPVLGNDDDDKHGADTGVADVAVASAIALVAAGAVVFSRKRK
ncbi:MAG: hypothetical protein LBC82_00185 [Oscillospiraceae bacterium]|nr:hypothetical protein [Oscillospiraceae bacterium]